MNYRLFNANFKLFYYDPETVLPDKTFFIKPFVFLLTLPINILTIGLFTLVINALIIILVTYIVPGFTVDGFWWALLLSLLLTGTRILFGTDK